MSDDDSQPNAPIGPSEFASTHWSIVLAAGHRSSPGSRGALATLCTSYWFPLYAYARRRTRDLHEAQDLTQEFFAALLEKDYLAAVRPERGRFRAFLLTAFKHFMANEWEKAHAQKRGGGVVPIPLDFVAGESRFIREPADGLTPERLFERQWVLSLLDRVLQHLRDEFARAGKLDEFDRLKVFITPQTSAVSHSDVARDLAITENAVAVAAHRLRRRYRELLRAEIAQTVAGPGEVDDEIRSLFAAFSS
jgi:RNA polymerase sigma-70 factor (ECF subfamily)